MTGEPLLAYAELVAELRRRCAARHSGTLFIATASNHSGCFGLRDGNIVAIRFRLSKGVDALSEISKIERARCTFTNQVIEDAGPLPPTGDVLRLLTGNDADAAAARLPLTDEQFSRAQTLLVPALAEFLGPMATIVVREQLAEARRHGHDVQRTIDAIAKEIQDPAKAASFKREVLQKLGE